MLKLTKDLSAHVHVDYFETEDAAFAFLHGVHLGAHMPYVGDEHDFGSYLADEHVIEAFLYGIQIGIAHRGRVAETEFDLATSGGFKTIVRVTAGGTK